MVLERSVSMILGESWYIPLRFAHIRSFRSVTSVGSGDRFF